VVHQAFVRRDATAFDRQGFDPDIKRDLDEARAKIRCPACRWEPQRNSRWFCAPMGAPEHFNGGCGHRWNTFDTGGRCPGCQHQWRFTSCLSCGVASPHLDWYEDKPARQ
jgi:hypothetical protein